MEGLHLLEMVVHAKSPGIVDKEGVSSETAIEKLNSENIEKNQRWDTSHYFISGGRIGGQLGFAPQENFQS